MKILRNDEPSYKFYVKKTDQNTSFIATLVWIY